jgi:hypothetical protein
MKTLWLIALLLLGVPLFAQDQSAQVKENPRTSGNAFVRVCSAIENEKKLNDHEFGQLMDCLGYVSGFTDGVEHEVLYTNVNAKTPTQGAAVPFCIPDDVEDGQLVRVVLKYIRDNPAEAHKRTPLLIMRAFGKAYPCPNK